MKKVRKRKINSLYGFVVGDCLGVPYEFSSHNKLTKLKMVGNMVHNQPLGTWSDDTAFTLATLDSDMTYDNIKKQLKSVLSGKYFPDNIMFDVGATTLRCLSQEDSLNDFNEQDSGNGALMRMLPVAFYTYDIKWLNDVYYYISKVSYITHKSTESFYCCLLYCRLMYKLFEDIDISLIECIKDFENYYRIELFKPIKECTNNGYVVDSLNIVINICENATSFEDGMLKAINLGGDTDTHCALIGSILGIKFGVPQKYINKIRNKELIDEIIKQRIC